jgi:hypothetical protein
MVHPPGYFLVLAPVGALTSALGPAQAFSLARWLATLVGAANIALSARVAHRAAGPVAGVAAAVAYAVFPEIVAYERNPYLEPFLNLACLLLADAWLSDRVREAPRRAFAAGVALGLACTVKLWGVVWVMACLVSAPDRRAITRLAAGAAVAVVLVAGPFFAMAPASFVEQTLVLQAMRPPDGMAVGLGRVPALFRLSGALAAAALGGVMAAAWRRESPAWRGARFFGAAWALLLVAFVVSRTYWPEYNAHLAPATAHLAGLGAAGLWNAARGRGPALAAAAVAILVAVPLHPLAHSVRGSRHGGDLMTRVARTVDRTIPRESCWVAFEPAWALAADRLPQRVADVYATMLIEARHASRQGLPNAYAAFQTRAPQRRIRQLLRGCEFLSLGARGHGQLTPGTLRWIERRWTRVVAATEETGLDVWRLSPRSGAAASRAGTAAPDSPPEARTSRPEPTPHAAP